MRNPHLYYPETDDVKSMEFLLASQIRRELGASDAFALYPSLTSAV